jgi:hypothetical protein
MVPVVLSIDYFTRRATTASMKVAVADAKMAGKIGSVVECRPAIRSCNAGSWIERDLQPVLEDTHYAHYQGILRSLLVMSGFEGYTAAVSR